jgi:hypothetical protein
MEDHHDHHDDKHEIDPAIYSASRVDKKDYNDRAAYEHKKLVIQVAVMVVVSGLISLGFYLYLNSHITKNVPPTPAF